MNNDASQIVQHLLSQGYTEEQIMQYLRDNNMLDLPVTAPNWTTPEDAGSPNTKGFGANLGSMFYGLKNKITNLHNTKLPGGITLGNAGAAIGGIYQGANAIKGLYDNSQQASNLKDLKNDISLSMASNPMHDMYLDASDEKTLRQMRNGTGSKNISGAVEGVAKGIPQALLSALIGGLTGGGLPGAIVGGVGSLVNSGIKGYGSAYGEEEAKLQGLYSKLKRAEDDYNTMKRPRGLRSAGLSNKYFNQLY